MANARTTTLGLGLWHVKFLKAAIVYNLVVMALFFAIYYSIDFSKHFTSPAPVTLRGKLYFTMMVHTAAGANDIVPSTDFARTVITLHSLAAWMQVFLVFLT